MLSRTRLWGLSYPIPTGGSSISTPRIVRFSAIPPTNFTVRISFKSLTGLTSRKIESFTPSCLSGRIQNFVIEKRYIRKDGQLVWVRATANVIAEDAGRPTSIIGIVENIQDRKEAEAAVLRSREELGEFAHTVAHDLQAPLRGLLSYSQLLARQYRGKLDAEADELLRFIVDSARKHGAAIRALLRYAEAGEER